MRTKLLLCCGLLIIGLSLSIADAAIIDISLMGNGGVGLRGGSENPVVVGGGSGGEIGAGITFDNVSLQLTINIGWGSGNGFTDLTGNATAGHIHGFTASPAPASFNENAGVMIGLDSLAGWNPSATNGGFSNTVSLSAAQATALNEGRLYINIHTTVNPNGEIRGYLIVPEPTSLALLATGLGCAFGVGLFRRLRRRDS